MASLTAAAPIPIGNPRTSLACSKKHVLENVIPGQMVLKILEDTGTGYHIGENFLGASAVADD